MQIYANLLFIIFANNWVGGYITNIKVTKSSERNNTTGALFFLQSMIGLVGSPRTIS